MIYRFSDILNKDLYTSAQVLYVAGNINLFYNLIVDRCKEQCRGEIDETIIPDAMLLEMGLAVEDKESTTTSLNVIDFDEYPELSKIPAITGKWFSSIDYSLMSKKQKDVLERFIKSPNEHGILVVRIPDYKDYKGLLRNRILLGSQTVHLIQTSFPSWWTLQEIVYQMFSSKHVEVDKKAIELFIQRVGKKYDTYQDLVDKISLDYENGTMHYPDMLEALKGVENFVIDDFIVELTTPMPPLKRVIKARKIYKIANMLLSEYTARNLALELARRLNIIIEMRVAITKGVVPVGVKFVVDYCKERLPETSNLKRLSNYKFMQIYKQAQLTSLQDWVYMKLLLPPLTSREVVVKSQDKDKGTDKGAQTSVQRKWEFSYLVTEEECMKALLAVMNRSRFSEHRLLNDMKFKDSLHMQLDQLNRVYGTQEVQNGS